MNNRRFMLKVLNGSFNNLYLWMGMEADLVSLMEYFDNVTNIEIKLTGNGYQVIFENDNDDDASYFFAKFIELENY